MSQGPFEGLRLDFHLMYDIFDKLCMRCLGFIWLQRLKVGEVIKFSNNKELPNGVVWYCQ